MLKKEIKRSLNKNLKLDCKTAFKLINKFKISIDEFMSVVNSLNIRIDNCELGVFGELKYSKMAYKNFDVLEKYIDNDKKISCKKARELASKLGFDLVRSSIMNFNIDVKNCELGCFKERNKLYSVKTKTWIEDANKNLLFGKGQVMLLKNIQEEGSILNGAKKMGIPYKKAWLHLQSLQHHTKEKFIHTKQGRGANSGTKLSEKALEFISKYLELEKDIEEYANKRFKELFLDTNKNS
ncbi:hypothetical protein [uncultured Campylobacter sp.]|uniref:winged helix-turn-helix domain-containing protein n=1 Tax=uncultured Campylobacter sp. TaxID=218934 RepID=UPI002618704A|nr:hypothetical protein [uncultured Campylobacter sp.]